ncbi:MULTISPECIES: hypothetical protein [unclassified Janibacter]|uniref:hypothetical protein n=1 Tax=unclassified Janibacter TaxID=2649294 RepID=UPI003CFF77D1
MIELPDGRIAAFWNSHGSVAPRYKITTSAGDITSFGAQRLLVGSGLENDKSTYMTVMRLRGNANPYTVFTRRQSDHRWVMTTSKDLVRWTPAVALFSIALTDSIPYPKFVTTGWRTVHIAVSNTTANGSIQPSSMFHMYLKDGVFRQSDGSAIRTLAEVAGTSSGEPRPIDPVEGTQIYDGRSADGEARVYDIALTSTGQPTIVLNTGGPEGPWTDKWFQRRSGTWVQRTLVRMATTPWGITMRHDDPARAFLSRDVLESGTRELEEYRTTDGGETWTRRELTSNTTPGGNRTPATPWGAQDGPVSVAWLRGPYTTFNKGQWDTSVTLETTGPAPVSMSSSWPWNWDEGAGVSAQVTRGVGGSGISGLTITLRVRKPGETEKWIRSRVTDMDGRASFPVNRYYPKGTLVRLYKATTTNFGLAVSPSHRTT